MDQQLIKRNLKAASSHVYEVGTLLVLATGLIAGALIWPLVAATVGQEFISSPEKEERRRRGDRPSL